ncbi:putative baseplate assembly protein [Nonomuraea sp. NPDC002799]
MVTGLPLPGLDDRRWQDLVDEARALIPLYAPGWTDHNAHDPGIMLMELFAWLAEMDLYRVNQVTDGHRRRLLALAGITPLPPRPAGTLLGLSCGRALAVPAGLEFEGRGPFGERIRFRARHGLTVQPGRLVTVATGAAGAGPSGDGGVRRDVSASLARERPVLPFGPDPRPGAALYLGFDLPCPWPAGTVLSLGTAFADDGGAHSAELAWEQLTRHGTWAPLTARGGPARVSLTFPARAVPGEDGLAWIRVRLARGGYDAPPVLTALAMNAVEAVQAVPGVTTLTIARDAVVEGDPPAPGSRVHLDLELSPAGEVTRLGFPAGPSSPGLPTGPSSPGLPTGPSSPGLPAGPSSPDSPAGPFSPGDRPLVRVLECDLAERRLTLAVAAVCRGTGAPSQRIEIPGAPISEDDLRLHSQEGGSWRTWAIRPDFDASGRADAHAVAGRTGGSVTLGDGERGRTAPPGSTLLLTARLTRAEHGNLPVGAIDRVAGTPVNRALLPGLDEIITALGVRNVVPATGGAAEETVAEAGHRAAAGWTSPARAVTLDDHVALALATPGTRPARAEARANAHPGFPCLTTPGIVTVLVLPHLPAGRPEPSPGLLRAVAAHLCPRRVLGTRIEVAGPVYVTVTVRATVAPAPGARPAELPAAVHTALDRFFDPLTGGPDGAGWPFGRDVYRAEVLRVLDEVPGVSHVAALELAAGDGPPGCADLCVGPTGLVASGPHEIEVTP